MTDAEWLRIGEIVRPLATPIQGGMLFVLGYIAKLLHGIREQLQIQNNRVSKLETWRESHQELSEDRWEEFKEYRRGHPRLGNGA